MKGMKLFNKKTILLKKSCCNSNVNYICSVLRVVFYEILCFWDALSGEIDRNEPNPEFPFSYKIYA